MMTNKFRLLTVTATVLILLTAILMFLNRQPSPPSPPEPLVIAVANALLSTPVLIAAEQGFFTDEGLQVTLQRHPSGKEALDTVIQSQADVAIVAETPVVFASLAKASFSIIANIALVSEHTLIARPDRGIRQVTDLRGRRIGVGVGTTAHYFLHVLLSDEGLLETEVELVPLPATAQATALATGRVDAVATFEPYATECRQAVGETAILFSTGIRYLGFSSLVTSREFSRQRPEVAFRLLRAIDRAIAWIHRHRQEAIQFVAQEFGISVATADRSWNKLQLELMLDQPFISLLEAETRWVMEIGLVPAATMPNYLDYIDPSVLKRLRPDLTTVIKSP
jgi:NitT/TauT family transport system substrate-binding protein